ncbi:MAG TPA: PLP-dependent aminotransferase family protein [Bacillota bacterium]|nr:PLP-dependent aminotransferase family protein [Bacillota bacterium]
MYRDLKLNQSKPAYLQIKDYLKDLILKGVLRTGAQLPATRELARILGVSRNTIILAYQDLADDGFLEAIQGRGNFVADVKPKTPDLPRLDWSQFLNQRVKQAMALDMERNELPWKKGMLSFKSIAPDADLFELEEFKRAVAERLSVEGKKLLNYGYARGYQPLIDYLVQYMRSKGVYPEGKDIIVTNGFTEGFNLILSALTKPGDRIICENPTHNTALKIMRLHQLEIAGIRMTNTGMATDDLKERLQERRAMLGYLVPSYHNPTGLVTPLETRLALLKLFTEFGIPVVEDGFNEELRYSGTHVSPLITLAGTGNQVVYLGSFSKILFPGLRVGWVMGDAAVVDSLISLKRALNIHTSALDQAVLYEYLQGGQFEKYLKKARRVYREKHEAAVEIARRYIPCRRIWGEGGLHIFIELEEGIDARMILKDCYERGVLFLPGDVFYSDGSGVNTFRLGISRVSVAEMEAGFKIIGEAVERAST